MKPRAINMSYRPYRAPRQGRHFLMTDVICMEWQVGQAIWQLELIEYLPAASTAPALSG